jgi:Tfp pilus assembly protein PilN
MKQHPIDLLPESIYARSLAGLRTGRVITALGMSLAVLVVAATHSRLTFRSAEDRLASISVQANQVLALETKSKELRKELAQVRQFTDLYDKVAFPLDISAVLASVIAKLPASVTLDQLDFNAAARQSGITPRTTRSADPKNAPPPPRVLVVELSGFAASDQHVAELVRNLESAPVFRDVSLDYSRTRGVRGVSAREFRLSFRVDLDAQYVIRPAATAAQTSPAHEEVALGE